MNKHKGNLREISMQYWLHIKKIIIARSARNDVLAGNSVLYRLVMSPSAETSMRHQTRDSQSYH